VSVAEATDPLEVAGALRVPVFSRDDSPSTKSGALEEFILVSAHWCGEMHAERRVLMEEGATAQDEWDTLQGWEVHRRGKTDASVDRAKADMRPDLWRKLQNTRRRVRALTDEIARLDRDFEKASRAYTIISGG
jgi:hypothetical protein